MSAPPLDRAKALLQRHPWLWAVLLGAAFLPLKLYGFQSGWLNIHGARDLERAWQLIHGERLWVSGPEMSFGGAVPGWFYYGMLALTQFPDRNPLLAAMLPGVLFCVGIGIFFDGARRVAPWGIALAGAVLLGTFPFGSLLLRYIWNPAMIFAFTGLTFYGVLRASTDQNGNWLGLSLIAGFLAAQCHLSGFLLVLAVVLWIVVGASGRPSWKTLAIVAAVVLVLIGPYFIKEALTGWPDQNRLKWQESVGGAKVVRLKFVPTFWQVFGLQMVVLPGHSDLLGLGFVEIPPFTFFERLYRYVGESARNLGDFGFFLSLVMAAFALVGIGTCFLREKTPQRSLARFSLLVLLCVCLPLAFWNPNIGAGKDIRHPERYYYALWPGQFYLAMLGIRWLLARFPSKALAGFTYAWVAIFGAVGATIAVWSAAIAIETGIPTLYSTAPRGYTRALNDKMELARVLVEHYGITEPLFVKRVHADRAMMHSMEEDLVYELRWAVETAEGIPEADSDLYFFLFEAEDRARLDLQGARVVSEEQFGSMVLLAFRPSVDLGDWHPDAPTGWWWY